MNFFLLLLTCPGHEPTWGPKVTAWSSAPDTVGGWAKEMETLKGNLKVWRCRTGQNTQLNKYYKNALWYQLQKQQCITFLEQCICIHYNWDDSGMQVGCTACIINLVLIYPKKLLFFSGVRMRSICHQFEIYREIFNFFRVRVGGLEGGGWRAFVQYTHTMCCSSQRWVKSMHFS